MCIVLLNEMVTCWWSDSEQLWRWSSCGPSSYRVTADTEITVRMCSRQNCAIHSHRDPQNMHACFNSSILPCNIQTLVLDTHLIKCTELLSISLCKMSKFCDIACCAENKKNRIGRCSPICYINKKTLQKGKTKQNIYNGIIGPTCLLLLWFLTLSN